MDQSLQNQFGIGQYYVEQGRGKEYESTSRNLRLSAKVAVTADGAATLKRLIIE